MLVGLVVLLLSIAAGLLIIGRFKLQFPFLDAELLKRLLFYHFFLAFVYYLYATFNPSDSKYYYASVVNNFGRIDWTGFYGTSTIFIKFVAYPFINYLGFTYEAMMVLFAFLGFLGFVFMYIFFKENIKFKHTLFGFDLLTLFIFLPNLHFWSSSLGKGSMIFLGIGMFFFAISRFRERIIYVLLGGLIIYHVRPHIMLVILVASAMGFIFSTRGIGLASKILFLAGACIAFFFIYKDVLSMVGIQEEEFVTQGLDLTHRARELTKATSGIDIGSYSLIEQLFAFVYRPLFFDAPGILGLIVSFENVFYLIMTFKVLNLRAIRFVISGSFLVKAAMVSFITVSIALAQVSGNLGLAMRQKSQVMILFLFVIISFLDSEKMKLYQRKMRLRSRQEARRAFATQSTE